MTNLLPPNAKKQIVAEYWARMICAWVLVWSVCLLIGVVLLWPTYVLLTENIAARSDSVSAATERTAEFETLRAELQQSTRQAQAVLTLTEQVPLSSVVDDVWSLARPPQISLQSISVGRSGATLKPIAVSGRAFDRRSLAQFRDQLEALPYVETVDLPIESLARNENISFSLTVIVLADTL